MVSLYMYIEEKFNHSGRKEKKKKKIEELIICFCTVFFFFNFLFNILSQFSGDNKYVEWISIIIILCNRVLILYIYIYICFTLHFVNYGVLVFLVRFRVLLP